MLKEFLQELYVHRRVLEYIRILSSERVSVLYNKKELDFMREYVLEHVKLEKKEEISKMITPEEKKQVIKKTYDSPKTEYVYRRHKSSARDYRSYVANPDEIHGSVYHNDKPKLTPKEYKQLQDYIESL